MYKRYEKRKAPWGTGPSYWVNILGGLFGLTTSWSANRSTGEDHGRKKKRVVPVS